MRRSISARQAASMVEAAYYDWRVWFDNCTNGGAAVSSQTPDLPTVTVMPCALVYIDRKGKGSPNCTDVDPFCYVEQAITLNRSLLAAGMPVLTIVTNARPEIQRYLSSINEQERPKLHDLTPSLSLPPTTRFYAAHFKLDLLEEIAQGSQGLPDGALALLLDTDMVALRQVDQDLLPRCYRNGVGAFDISDQEFFAYGARRVVRDLEVVAGKQLKSPRWYGGECLLVSASFVKELVPRARDCFQRYSLVMDGLNHNGDEVFVSAALNLLADDGHPIIDVGSYRMVGRHWSGNTHRDLRWFRHCSLLHLPDQKKMLEKQARMRNFERDRIWRRIASAHILACLVSPVKRLLRTQRAAWRQRARGSRPLRSGEAQVDVLLFDSEPKMLSRLASALTSRGMTVMCTVDAAAMLSAAMSTHPRVVVMSARSTNPQEAGGFESLRSSPDRLGRPFLIALYREGDHVDPAQWDEWYLAPTQMSELVEAAIGYARSAN